MIYRPYVILTALTRQRRRRACSLPVTIIVVELAQGITAYILQFNLCKAVAELQQSYLWSVSEGVITSQRSRRVPRSRNKKYLTSIPLKGDVLMYTAAVSKKIPP